MTRILTQSGLKKLETELEERKTKLRHEIAESIKEAKDQGDLSENAEYSEAKRQQTENEMRISELEAMLKDSIVAAERTSSALVGMGSRLSVKIDGATLSFEIVGSNETDPALGKISNESPLGKEFMGKKKGEKVEVSTPSGVRRYEILAID